MPRHLRCHPHDPVALTVAIARAYVSHNAMTARELPALILRVHSALAGAGSAVAGTAQSTSPRLRSSPARPGRMSW